VPLVSIVTIGVLGGFGKGFIVGNILTLKGPNGLSTTWQYDSLGRKTLESRADGTTTKVHCKAGGAGDIGRVRGFVSDSGFG
jgi:YD repeat-containing protein